MPDRPHISVVIPHLNDPVGLRRCLAALAKQQRDGVPFEVIVVDNGSGSLPRDVCAEFPFVRLGQESTPGPGPARSRGAHMASADIVAFLDADCFAEPGWIAGLAGYFDAHPYTQVIGGDVRIAHVDPRRPTAIEAYESIYSYRMRLFVERDGFCGTGNMAVRRDTFRAVGDFGGISIAEDREWGRRAAARGVRIDFVPGIRATTPARASFAELIRKWDRHLGHDFAEVSDGRKRSLWILRSFAIAASPLAEIPRILASTHVSSPRERWHAFQCLVRIRLHRTRRMLGLAFGGDPTRLTAAWNRASR